MTEHIPFDLPDIGEQEIEAVVEALRSGWVSTGPVVREFERDFAALMGGGVEAVAINSATAGLHLALEALDIGPGDEVLVPTWTFTATAEVVRYLGAEPVLCDVDPATLNLDLEDATRRVTAKTKAIMPVHFAGQAISPTAIEDFATTHSLAVVEDAAHALPARSEGQLVGAGSSEATVFSFYATKTMTTGEGGMLVTRDPEVARRARVMRLHGISRDAFDRYRSQAPAWRYEVVAPGFKYNLTDPAAAMGRVQLRRASQMRDRRASIAAMYDDAFASIDLEVPAGSRRDGEHSWHLYVVRLPRGRNRDAFIDCVSQHGVSTSVHFIPLHLHPYWSQRFNMVPDDLPVAAAEFERVVSLPIFSSMTEAQVERVIDSVARGLAE